MTAVKMRGTAAKQNSFLHWRRIWRTYRMLIKLQYFSQCSH